MSVCPNCHARHSQKEDSECMVCGRIGCPKCQVLVGVAESHEWQEGTETLTSTGSLGLLGTGFTGFIARGKTNEAHWTSERLKRWACSWECFDRWVEQMRPTVGEPEQRQRILHFAGITLSHVAAARVRARWA